VHTAWRLSQQWNTCRLQVFDDAGHGGGNSFVPAVINALNEFASF
jgi:proline iminopeptidase